MVLNKTNLSNPCHGQAFLRNIRFSALISGVKLLLIGLRNALMDSYIFSILYKLIHFSFPLNPEIHRMGSAPNILCPRYKEQKESQPFFIFYCKFSKITLDFISEPISLKYAVDIPFKITRKTMIMGTSSDFDNGIQLNILLTLSLEILLLSLAQKKPLRRPGASFKIIMEILKYNSANFLRLSL